MDAGRLRDRVTIRREVNTKNARGGLDRSWTTLGSEIPAEVRSINGREAVIGSVLQGVAHFQVTLRYRSDVSVADQLVWNGRELNVHSAEDRLGDRRWLMIHASTQAPQGAKNGA